MFLKSLLSVLLFFLVYISQFHISFQALFSRLLGAIHIERSDFFCSIWCCLQRQIVRKKFVSFLLYLLSLPQNIFVPEKSLFYFLRWGCDCFRDRFVDIEFRFFARISIFFSELNCKSNFWSKFVEHFWIEKLFCF